MRILLAGGEFFDYPMAMDYALRKAGHDVRTYIMRDTSACTLSGRMRAKRWFMLHKNTEKLYLPPARVWEQESRKVYELYKKFQPEVMVAFAAYILSPHILKKMTSCKKALWVYDAVHNIPMIGNSIPYYDCVYSFERSDIPWIEKRAKKALFLPLCADERHYYPLERKKEYDLCFVGALSAERRQIIRKIAHRFPDRKIIACGKYLGSKDLAGHLKRQFSSDRLIFTNKNVSQKESNELYASSRICLNLHKNQTKYGANMRTFELLAAGAFQLTDRNPYIRNELRDCLVSFGDVEELMDQLDYYWNNGKEREIIAKKGHEKVMREDLFVNRAAYILNTI